MNIYLAILTAATCLCGSLVSQVSIQTPVVDVGVGDGDGYYYEDGYDDGYDDGYYQDWTGPGWYYGIWYGDEGDYNNFRGRHYGDHGHGRGWGGRGGHGGGGHGGHGGGGHGGHR